VDEPVDELGAALQILARNPAFANIEPEHLAAIGRSGRRRLILQGSPLMIAGEPSEQLYLMLKGRVQIERAARGRAPRLAVQLGPGEIVGEVSLLHGSRHTASAIALEDLHVLEISKDEVQAMFRGHRPLLQAFLRMVHQRLSGR